MPVFEKSVSLENEPNYLSAVSKNQTTEDGKKEERIIHTQGRFRKAFDYYVFNNRDASLRENEGFFTGATQWKPEIKEKIERTQNRAAAVINQTAVVQNSVSGGERQSRTEIKAYAFNADPEDQLESEVSTILLKYHNKQDDLDFLQSDMFFHGNNAGEAWAESFFSKTEPRKPWGTILTRIRHPRNVYLDPNSREYNINKDARFVFVWDYMDINVIVAENPSVSPTLFDYPSDERMPKSMKDSDRDEYRAQISQARGAFPGGDPAPFFDSAFAKVKRIRMYEKYRKKVIYLHDMRAEDVVESFIDLTMLKELPEFIREKFDEINGQPYKFSKDIIADARALAAAAPDNYTILETFEDRIASHYISGRHEFEYIPDIGINLFPLYRYTPFLIDGQPVSYTELFKHPQKEINSMHSKLESMLKRANWLVLSEEGTLSENQNMQEAQDTGHVSVKRGMLGKVTSWVNPGLNYIGAYVTLIQHLQQMLTSAAGSEDAFRGKSPGANMPGVSLALLRNQTAMIMQPMIDKLNETKRIIAKTQLQMIYTWLPDTVIERIVNQQINIDQNKELSEKIKAREESNKPNIKESFRKLGAIEHDVVFDETISNPTMKLARLHALLEVANVMQTPPPMGLVMKLADLSKEDGDEWIEMFEKQQQLIAMGLQQGGNGQKPAAGPDRNLPNQQNVLATG